MVPCLTVIKDEYDEICNPPGDAEAPLADLDNVGLEGGEPKTIGSYSDCRYVAGGVTAEVYRSKSNALKVIVETRDMKPHNPRREAKILESLRGGPGVIPLLEVFHDQNQRLVLVFPFMPVSLAHVMEKVTAPLPDPFLRHVFTEFFKGLDFIHSQGIIHRDIKPSAILIESTKAFTTKPHVYISDFGTAWHPEFSSSDEPADEKILDVGTSQYRAPEALFGHKSYTTALDLWAAGIVLAECIKPSHKPIFESRPAHEDGSQLGLILSIFKTLGSPTKENWPEAENFKTPPFEFYRSFEGVEGGWEGILPTVRKEWRELVKALVKYESAWRVTARQVCTYYIWILSSVFFFFFCVCVCVCVCVCLFALTRNRRLTSPA